MSRGESARLNTTPRSRTSRGRAQWHTCGQCSPAGSSTTASRTWTWASYVAASARAFTQEISRYVFERGVFERGVAEHGERLLGIRYLSRLGDDIENWATFEGSEPHEKTSEEISRDDPDVLPARRPLSS